MAEDETGKEPSKGSSVNSPRQFVRLSCLLLPWVCLLAVAVVFQVQFVSLQKELTAIKLQVLEGNSTAEKERSLAKRSSDTDKDLVKKTPGIDAAHFRGTFPFQKIEKDGRIGPWFLSSADSSFVALRAKNTELEITAKGLYYVYSQIYYLTKEPPNSYQIIAYNGTEERNDHRVLSTCAGQGRTTIGEVSCYTGFTGMFNKGHRLYLHQIEQNRIINNSNGCSFFGVILLKKVPNSRRKT